VSTAILFSTADVSRLLAGIPSVAALLPDPEIEGHPSAAFPRLRKTETQPRRHCRGAPTEDLPAAGGPVDFLRLSLCDYPRACDPNVGQKREVGG